MIFLNEKHRILVENTKGVLIEKGHRLYLEIYSQQGAVLPPPRGYWAMFGDMFGCHNWRGSAILASREWARGAAPHRSSLDAPRHRMISPSVRSAEEE